MAVNEEYRALHSVVTVTNVKTPIECTYVFPPTLSLSKTSLLLIHYEHTLSIDPVTVFPLHWS